MNEPKMQITSSDVTTDAPSQLRPWVEPAFEREPLREALSSTGSGTKDEGVYGS